MAMNVVKGWPLGGALDHNVAPTAGEGIVAGMFVKRSTVTGKLIKCVGAVKELAMFALDDQSAGDVIEADSMPVLIGNALVETDQFIAAVYAPGDELEVSPVALEAGKVRKKVVAAAPTVGWVDSLSVVDDIPMLRIALNTWFGAAS